MKKHITIIVIVLIAILSAACTTGTEVTYELLHRETYAWPECAYGGTKIVFGFDQGERDGYLGDGEIDPDLTVVKCEDYSPPPQCYSDSDCAYLNYQVCNSNEVESQSYGCYGGQCLADSTGFEWCENGCWDGTCNPAPVDPFAGVYMWVDYLIPTSLSTQIITEPDHIKLRLECYDFVNQNGFEYSKDVIGKFDFTLEHQKLTWQTSEKDVEMLKLIGGCHATATIISIYGQEFPLNGGYFSVGIATSNANVLIGPVYNMCQTIQGGNIDYYWFGIDWMNQQITTTCGEEN